MMKEKDFIEKKKRDISLILVERIRKKKEDERKKKDKLFFLVEELITKKLRLSHQLSSLINR